MGPLVSAAAAVVLAGGPAWAAAAAPPQPHVRASVGTAAPRSAVDASGDCPSGNAVALRLIRFSGPHVDIPLTQIDLNADGTYTAAVTVPAVPDNYYLLVARCLSTATTPPTETANVAVKLQVVTPPPATPSRTPTPTPTRPPTTPPPAATRAPAPGPVPAPPPPPTTVPTQPLPTSRPAPTRASAPARTTHTPTAAGSPAAPTPSPSVTAARRTGRGSPPYANVALAGGIAGVLGLGAFVWRRRRARTGWIF